MGTDTGNHDNVGNGEVGATGERTHPSANANQKQNGTTHSDQANGKDRPHKTLNGQTAGESSTVHEQSTDIEAIMPKLHQADYYTEPRIHELAAKERADPGYCKRVKDFVDESKKPAVGQGLNKPAEVTLLNIKCIDKKTGKQFTEGERVEKYKMMLKKKTEEQGAEFLLFDPVKGEWKFKVKHFSSYKLDDEDYDEV